MSRSSPVASRPVPPLARGRGPGRSLSPTVLLFVIAVYLALSGNLAAASAILEKAGDHAVLLLLVVFLALTSVNLTLLGAAALLRLLKPVAALLLLLTAVSAYFMDEFGVFIDEDMVANVMQTDRAEALELITWPLLLRVGLLGLLPAVLLWRVRLRRGRALAECLRGLLLLLGVLAVLAGLVASQYKVVSLFSRGNTGLRWRLNPTAPILAAMVYHRGRSSDDEPLQPVAEDARPRAGGHTGRRRLVVLVLGETARADHFSLNGYERQTNQQLALRDVVNFPDVHACGTSTAESLPCMFSAVAREDYSRKVAKRSENLLDVLQRAGIGVLWRENNSGCKGVCERVDVRWTASLGADPRLDSPFGWYDEALLAGLQESIDSHDGDLFIVLHQKGSHGPSYYRRSPPGFKPFLPECSREDIQNCSQDELINAYDNTIVYTDHVLSLVIDLLQANEPESAGIMVYISDHGESLGENGVYLHGFPYWMAPEEQTHVPMVAWLSASCDEVLGLSRPLLDSSRLAPLSHDHLFHTILGLFDVSTAVYDPALDVFAAARGR